MLLSIPSVDVAGDPITVIELGAAACVCPKDTANLSKFVVSHENFDSIISVCNEIMPHI